MNPDLYACLPPDKKEEYKKMFQIDKSPVPEKEPIEKLLSIKEMKVTSLQDITLISSSPDFGTLCSIHNPKYVHRGLNGEEWLVGARPYHGY